MCKVVVIGLGASRTCMVSDSSPNDILWYYKVNPDGKIVYIDGKIVSREKMKQPLPERGMIHMVVRDRTIIRD